MPHYVFINPETEEVHDMICSYDEMMAFKKANPTFNQEFSVVKGGRAFIDPVIAGRTKPDRGFNDMMIEMKKKVGYKKDTLKTYY